VHFSGDSRYRGALHVAVGVITDSSGAVVPNATVTIRSVESGETRTVTTNAQGQYRFPLMSPGDYVVTAASKGLKSNITKISLLVGQEQTVNITMNAEGTKDRSRALRFRAV
jgi:hypothetical protein